MLALYFLDNTTASIQWLIKHELFFSNGTARKLIKIQYLFNMAEELIEYCISDVDILRRACNKFQQMFKSECNVSPYTEAVTIASACNRVFRRNFLKHNTVGIIPWNGYRLCDNQSRIGLQWLVWQEFIRGRSHLWVTMLWKWYLYHWVCQWRPKKLCLSTVFRVRTVVKIKGFTLNNKN